VGPRLLLGPMCSDHSLCNPLNIKVLLSQCTRLCGGKHIYNFPQEQVARTTAFVVRVLSVETIPTVPSSVAVSKLRRRFLSDRHFFIVVRLLKRWEEFGRLPENARRSPRTYLIPPSRAREDADHKSGGPRYHSVLNLRSQMLRPRDYHSCLSSRPRTFRHSGRITGDPEDRGSPAS